MRPVFIISLIFAFIIVLFGIRIAPMFGDNGIFDGDYHRRTIESGNPPYSNQWSKEKPYVCRDFDPADPEAPYRHCSLTSYLFGWIVDPSHMKVEEGK